MLTSLPLHPCPHHAHGGKTEARKKKITGNWRTCSIRTYNRCEVLKWPDDLMATIRFEILDLNAVDARHFSSICKQAQPTVVRQLTPIVQ
jgi:hypothetical protein